MSRLQQKALDVLWLAEPDSDEAAKRIRRCSAVFSRHHPRRVRSKARELTRRGYLHLPPSGNPCEAWLTAKGRSAIWEARNRGYKPLAEGATP